MRARTRALLAVPAAALAAGAVAVAARATYPRVGALIYSAAARLDARRAGLSSHVVDVDGLATAYYEGGPLDAPTVLLIHGYSADRSVWANFAAKLTVDHHVVVPDLAGHGETPFRSGAGYSAPAQADRVAALMDALGIEDAHVMGNSMGGFVAAHLARTHAARVRSLCLSDAAGVRAPERSEAEKILDRGEPNVFLIDHPDMFAKFYAMTMAKPPFAPGLVKAAMAADYVRRRDELEEIFDDFFEQDLLNEHLATINVPVLVMWGSEDQLVHPSSAQVWVDGIAHARQVTYDGIGHMPMVETPGRAARDYREFLAEVRGTA